MKVEDLNQEVKDKVMQLLNDAPPEKKSEAIMQSIEMMQEAMHEDLINEIVSILKNMSLCGLPVKKVWRTVKKALSKYTNELPTDSTN